MPLEGFFFELYYSTVTRSTVVAGSFLEGTTDTRILCMVSRGTAAAPGTTLYAHI